MMHDDITRHLTLIRTLCTSYLIMIPSALRLSNKNDIIIYHLNKKKSQHLLVPSTQGTHKHTPSVTKLWRSQLPAATKLWHDSSALTSLVLLLSQHSLSHDDDSIVLCSAKEGYTQSVILSATEIEICPHSQQILSAITLYSCQHHSRPRFSHSHCCCYYQPYYSQHP